MTGYSGKLQAMELIAPATVTRQATMVVSAIISAGRWFSRRWRSANISSSINIGVVHDWVVAIVMPDNHGKKTQKLGKSFIDM